MSALFTATRAHGLAEALCAVLAAMAQESMQGAYNAVAPEPAAVV